MDTCASSHLNSNVNNLSTIFNSCLYPSVRVGDGKTIPVTNTGHGILPTLHRPLHLHNVLVTPNIIKNLIYVCQFTRDNNCTIEFDAFGFSVKDFFTRHILLRCDSPGDLYPVTQPSSLPSALMSLSSSTWHQRLGHPVDTESKLGPEGTPILDPTLYRSLAGGLQYLTFTRPDLALWMFGLQLYASSESSLVAYFDADWAGCPATRRSTSGYCVFLGNNLLSWSSKRQHTLSRSSVEAEYRGVANVVAETHGAQSSFENYTPLLSATLVYCDNVSVVYLSANPVQHQRTKHIEIDIHFVRDMVAMGHVRVLHVPSRYQYADIFTKGLPSALFEEFRTSLSVRLPPAQNTGVRECS
ncbi:ribonuclease H-like domain-containing protein [Tanacetum coccineum]|uniref:Ribonuclease H-like domain-containing protein n=1 Tax=Tanacetum coccineum TaxID=301880 RepID=A0ABQ5HC76_9ASTR